MVSAARTAHSRLLTTAARQKMHITAPRYLICVDIVQNPFGHGVKQRMNRGVPAVRHQPSSLSTLQKDGPRGRGPRNAPFGLSREDSTLILHPSTFNLPVTRGASLQAGLLPERGASNHHKLKNNDLRLYLKQDSRPMHVGRLRLHLQTLSVDLHIFSTCAVRQIYRRLGATRLLVITVSCGDDVAQPVRLPSSESRLQPEVWKRL